MIDRVGARPARLPDLLGEVGKLPAFARRDFLVAWSYRMVFFTDAITLLVQTGMFYFVGLMVDPATVPSFAGEPATYLEFVAVGIAFGVFLQLGLGRVATAMRSEQLLGTLESLFLTPTSVATLQLGMVFYDLIYVPIRTGLFLLLVASALPVDFRPEGLAPAAVILLLFIPLVWGLGLISAAAVFTFRRGAGLIGIGGLLLNVASGVYFPLRLFPAWVQSTARANPVALALQGAREALLGGGGWPEAAGIIVVLAPMAILSLLIGMGVFHLALRRERRTGTLGLY